MKKNKFIYSMKCFSPSFKKRKIILCFMTLYLIGLGLGSEKDITLKGLEIVKRADIVYLEYYTSILGVNKDVLEAFYGREVLLADRTLVESQAEELLVEAAREKDVALLVVGDPFGATTHTDLLLRAQEADVQVEVVHNASVMNAVGKSGLELYKFGKTTSIPFWDDGFEPQTPYDVIKMNKENGLHTLCLLDIKVNEPTKEELRKGLSPKNSQPRFMTVNQGLDILKKIELQRGEDIIKDETLVLGVARLGQEDETIIAGTIKELLNKDFGAPLHSLIILGTLHDVEQEALSLYK